MAPRGDPRGSEDVLDADLEGLTGRLDRGRGDVLVELRSVAADAMETVVEEVLAAARRLVRRVASDLTD